MKYRARHAWFAVGAATAVICGSVAVAQRQASEGFVPPTRADIKRVFPGNSRQVWEQSRTLTLYSIDPGPLVEFRGKPTSASQLLHDHRILGKVVVQKPEQLRQFRRAVDDIYAGRPGIYARASCFEPRHAIRAHTTGKTVDMVICFSCGNAYLYRDQGENRSSIPVYSGRAAKTFNRLLAEANIPLAP